MMDVYYEDVRAHSAATKLGGGSVGRDTSVGTTNTDADIILNHLNASTADMQRAANRLEGVYATWSGQRRPGEANTLERPPGCGKYGGIIDLLDEQHRLLAVIEEHIANFERMV